MWNKTKNNVNRIKKELSEELNILKARIINVELKMTNKADSLIVSELSGAISEFE